ncbi:sigma factor-like helix-turn-helix DNA-binding protein [Clostridium perfringens]|nr:sigma factor-like helix-turn-helix DNA-binding protein [Clostridium perfringens]
MSKNFKNLEELLIDYRKLKIEIINFNILNNDIEVLKRELMISRIDNALSILTPNEMKIIKLRYIDGLGKENWYSISNKLFLSISRCHEIKKDALKKLSGLLNL